MPRIPFDSLPDDARLWIFSAAEPLSPDAERELLDEVDAFLDDWRAHGSPLTCARDWRYGQFLHVAVDERSVPPSGCSIDAMVDVLKGLEGHLGVRLVDHSPVWYRAAGTVRRATRPEFAGLAREGEVGPDTVVFDGTLTRVRQLRSDRWEVPASQSWHGKVFFSGES